MTWAVSFVYPRTYRRQPARIAMRGIGRGSKRGHCPYLFRSNGRESLCGRCTNRLTAPNVRAIDLQRGMRGAKLSRKSIAHITATGWPLRH